MKVAISILFEADDDDGMLEFSVEADFKDHQNGMNVKQYIQQTPNTISHIEGLAKVKFDVSYDDDEGVFMLIINGPVGDLKDAPYLVDDILESFITNLEKIGFRCLSKCSMVHETYPEEIESNTPKEFLN